MLRSRWTLAICILALAPAFGQQKEPPAPTIKSRTELVLIPTVVTQDGKLVSGLTAKDFIVLHNGKPENVAVFEEIDAIPAKVEPVSLPPHTVQNYATADRHQDVVILFIDFLNSTWSSRARTLTYLGELTRQFAESHTPVAVLVLSHKSLVQVQSFTSDPENLVKTIDRLSSDKPLSNEAMSDWSSPYTPTLDTQLGPRLNNAMVPPGYLDRVRIDQADDTLNAVLQISEAFRGVPGRKKLIWISTGFPSIGTEVSPAAANRSWADSTDDQGYVMLKIEGKLGLAWKALSDANISVYPIDSNGVTNPSWESEFSAQHSGASRLAPPSITETQTNTQSLILVAKRTGGLTCTLIPTKCLSQALADGSHYYLLGFYLHGENKPGWHRLKVTVDRPNASVRARDGFAIGEDAKQTPEKDKTDKAVVVTALAAPLDYTSVPLQLHWSASPTPGPETQLELVLISPPGGVEVSAENSSINVDYLAFIRLVGKPEGKTFPATLVSKLSPADQQGFAKSGFLFRKKVPLAPGRYEVRVYLRDNVANKTGTVSTVVDLTASPPAKSGESQH